MHPVSNKNNLSELYEDFWPVEHEPGSIADQLLTKGRLEGEAKGRLEGEAKGRLEGEEKGRLEGEAKGRALGEQQGQIAGEIKLIETLKLILGISSTSDDLSSKSLAELRQISEALQTSILHRRQ